VAIDVRAEHELGSVGEHDGVRDLPLDVLAPPTAIGLTSAPATSVAAHALNDDEPARTLRQDRVAEPRRAKVPPLTRIAHAPRALVWFVVQVSGDHIWMRSAVARGKRLPCLAHGCLVFGRAGRLVSAPQASVAFGGDASMHVQHHEDARVA